MIRFNQEICGNPEAASWREWLETNGLADLLLSPSRIIKVQCGPSCIAQAMS